MKFPTREEQKKLVQQWDETGRKLEEIRRNELRGMPYDWKAVDALLQLADLHTGPERTTSGLVEMQRLFMKRHPNSPTSKTD